MRAIGRDIPAGDASVVLKTELYVAARMAMLPYELVQLTSV